MWNSLSLSEASEAESQGGNKVDTMELLTGLLFSGLLTNLLYVSQAHLPRDDIAHSRLPPPTSISNKVMPPQTSVLVAVLQLRFPLPR